MGDAVQKTSVLSVDLAETLNFLKSDRAPLRGTTSSPPNSGERYVKIKKQPQPSAKPRLGGSGLAGASASPRFITLRFEETQQIQQRPGEASTDLHERLRKVATNSMSAINQPTLVITPSWLTMDASKILGVDGAVLISTSTCAHELPARIFVGTRKVGWQKELGDGSLFQYTLYPLGRELTDTEKNRLYDAMRFRD